MKNILKIQLQLFADGAGGASAGAADGASTASEAEGDNGVKSAIAERMSKRQSKNPLANVVYGKQSEEDAEAPVAGEKETKAATVNTEDRRAKFEELIKGEYRDLYSERVQNTVRERLKGTKDTVDAYEKLKPTLDVLYAKHGVKPGDIEGLQKAIDEDDSYWSAEAMEKGITIEQLKSVKKMERENAEMRAQMEVMRKQSNADAIYAKWIEQEAKAKQTYPSLSLSEEAKNPDFVRLLKSNVDVETAYLVVHKDEILPQAMRFAAETAQSKIANKIAANGNRPAENGTSGQASANYKSDVNAFTKADRAEIIRRVSRGEKIVL